VQIANNNYFQLFNLPESYDLDTDLLKLEYHKLQLDYHPDKHSSGSEKEKMSAQVAASYINDAYQTLNSPLKRAAYILTIRGKDVEKVDQNDLSLEVLVEQMELRESLGDLPKDDTALQALEDLKNSAHGKIQKKQLKFAKEIESGDLSAAKQTFHELQFLFKLLAEIEESEERLLDY
tara:strand:+ start:35 stop:568 length:534 start_codon:yes stop_codon:yes gene_type:complete